LEKPRTILDVGGGTGTLIKILKRSLPNCYTVNLELSIGDLKESKKRNAHSAYVLGDATKPPLREGFFDVAILSNILEHIKKQEGLMLLEKINYIAKKRIIAVPCNQATYESPDPKNPHQAHISEWTPIDFSQNYKNRRYGGLWLKGKPLSYYISTKLKLSGFAHSKKIYTIALVFLLDDLYDACCGLMAYPFNQGSILIAVTK